MLKIDPYQDPNPFGPAMLVDNTEPSFSRPRHEIPIWIFIVGIPVVMLVGIWVVAVLYDIGIIN